MFSLKSHKFKNMLRKFTALLVSLFYFSLLSNAQLTTFKTGSYIINMGVSPQTIGNGLKPYGFIYEMLKTYQVPVYWVINNSKSIDGNDFTHDGVSYKGGTFIISKDFLTKTVGGNTVAQRITAWQNSGAGMVGNYTSTPLTIDVDFVIRTAPVWTLDAQNGKIAQTFFSNAGIPSTAYNWLLPSQLGTCNDIFVMPHADPTWATHSNLRQWNRTKFGAIWAGCHAVSALEALSSGSDSMNFLSTKGLVLWTNHTGGTPPYIREFPAEAGLQYLGKTDNAHLNGSEQIYLPLPSTPSGSSSWRPGVKVGVYDASPANVYSYGAGNTKAAIDLIGRGFGLNTSGLVCYQAGHDISKSADADAVAAQRIFFNFSYQASTDKVPLVVPTFTLPSVMTQSTTQSFSVGATSNVTNLFTYQWTSSCGGTFSAPTSATTNYTAPNSGGDCFVTVTVTDPCGHQTSYTQ